MKTKVDDFIRKDTVSKVLLCPKDSEACPCLGKEIYEKLQGSNPAGREVVYFDLSTFTLGQRMQENILNKNEPIVIFDFYEKLGSPVNLWVRLQLFKIKNLKVIIVCESGFVRSVQDPALFFSPFVFERRVRSALKMLDLPQPLHQAQPVPMQKAELTKSHKQQNFEAHPFNLTAYTDNDDLLQLWSDAFLRNNNTRILLKTIYLQFIDLSKDNPSFSIGASNAMTLLVRSGELLCDKNFDGAHLEKPKMSGGYFDKSSFRGTYFGMARLAYGWFRGADFSNANLRGVDIGIKRIINTGFEIHKVANSKLPEIHAICDFHRVVILNTVTNTYLFDKKYSSQITSLTLSSDANFILVGCGNIVILEDLTAQKTTTIKTTSNVSSSEISDNNHFFILGTENGTIQLWDLTTSAQIQEFCAHEGDVTCIQFLPNLTDNILSAGIDGFVRHWKIKGHDSSLISVFKDREVDIWDICTDAQGKIVMTGGEGGEVNLHILSTKISRNIIKIDNCIRTIAYIEECNQILIGDVTGTVRLIDVATMTVIFSRPFHGQDWVENVYFDVSKNEVLSIGKDGSVSRFAHNVATAPSSLAIRPEYTQKPELNNRMSIYPAHDFPISDSYSPVDHTATALGYYDGLVQVFFRSNAEVIYRSSAIDNTAVWAVSFTKDLKTCISGHESGNLIIHEMHSNKHSYLSNGQNRILSICLTQDNTKLISSHGNQGVNVWDLETKSLYASYRGHTGIVKSVCQLNDQSISLSGGNDRTLRLWDYEQKKELYVVRMTSAVNGIKVDDEGQIITHCQDGNTLTWKAYKLADNAYSLSLVSARFFYSPSINISDCNIHNADMSYEMKSLFPSL